MVLQFLYIASVSLCAQQVMLQLLMTRQHLLYLYRSTWEWQSQLQWMHVKTLSPDIILFFLYILLPAWVIIGNILPLLNPHIHCPHVHFTDVLKAKMSLPSCWWLVPCTRPSKTSHPEYGVHVKASGAVEEG